MDRIVGNRRDKEIGRLISLQLEELSLCETVGGAVHQFPGAIEERPSDVESLHFPGFREEQRDGETLIDFEDDSTELERFGGGLLDFQDDVDAVVELGGGLIHEHDILELLDQFGGVQVADDDDNDVAETVDRFGYFEVGSGHQAGENISSDIDITHQNEYFEIDNANTDDEVSTDDNVSDYGEPFESASDDNDFDDYDSYNDDYSYSDSD